MITLKAIDFTDYKPEQAALIRTAMTRIDAVSGRISDAGISIDNWLEDMRQILAQMFPAAWMAGQNDDELITAARVRISQMLSVQFAFLDNFSDDIRATDWLEAYFPRARMYGASLTAPYSAGDIIRQVGRVLPLPAMPTEGTQCLSNCKCRWEITELSGVGNFDCFWIINSSDQCQTCIERARQWAPFRIRDNEVV